MGEAEDVLRRRERERAEAQRASEEARRAAAAESEAAARRDLAASAEGLAGEALAALEATDWPEGELIEVGVQGIWPTFLRRPKRGIAAWPVGGFQFKDKDDRTHVDRIYLLSDGRWIGGTYPTSLRTPRSFAEILESQRGATKRRGFRFMSDMPTGVLSALRRLVDGTPAP